MNEQDEALAKRRFAIISLVRLSGAVFLTLGLLALGGKLDLDPIAGWLLVGVGLIDFLVAPALLGKKWKSPQP